MSNSWFQFKRFRVEQSEAAMKVGTDGVLLGAWARVNDLQRRILDAGTGTGLIALMLAQRTETYGTHIDAIDIDAGSLKQARDNISESDWADRISPAHVSLQELTENLGQTGKTHCYDHIVCNPPYFVDALTSPAAGRTLARHAVSLSYAELAACAAELLNEKGIFSAIIPFGSEPVFTRTAAEYALYPSRVLRVRSFPDALPKRILVELSKKVTLTDYEELTVRNSDGKSYTEAYKALTRDFYLKF